MEKNYKIISSKVKELEKMYYSMLRDWEDTNENVEVIIGENVTCECVGEFLEAFLGVKVRENSFSWENDYLARLSFKIGTREIDIVSGKSLDTLFGEIKTAIVVGLTKWETQLEYESYLSSDDGDGMLYRMRPEFLIESSIEEIIDDINTHTYCDEDFEAIIKELGFEICIGLHEELGVTKYIDIPYFVKDAKIWLKEGYKQHTLYREVRPRERVEVLYLLNALTCGENIFCDEY